MATIRDVARLSGLSEATISYVINNGPRPVSPGTRQKVLEAMRELAYHPNASARQLARQRTECVGVVLAGLAQSNFSSAYFLEYIRGISYAAELHGYNIMLLTNHSRDLEAFSRHISRSRLVDGVLLIGSSVPDHVAVELHEADFPVVLVARRLLEHATYCVLQDYRDSAYKATQHLISNGYRRIEFLGQALRLNYGVERLEGYQRALAEAGMAYDPCQGLNRDLWDAQLGYFVNYRRPGCVEANFSIDTLVTVLYGLADPEQSPRILRAARRLQTRHNGEQPFGDWGVASVFPLYQNHKDLFGKSAERYHYHNGADWPYWDGVYGRILMEREDPEWQYVLTRWWEYGLGQGWLTPVEYFSPLYPPGGMLQGWSTTPAAAIAGMLGSHERHAPGTVRETPRAR